MKKNKKSGIIKTMKEVIKMGYKEFNKEQRAKDRERHKCITYVDKDKANEI